MRKRHVDLKRELDELRRKAEGVFRKKGSAGEPRPAAPLPLSAAVAGEETAAAGGVFYRATADAGAIWPDAAAFHREYIEALESPFFPAAATLAALRILKETPRERILYLDIETTGLSMTPLFLVGLMYSACERLVVDQLFARDYSEEEPVLRFLVGLADRFDVLVTFNGVTFDIPFIRERMTVHRLAFAPPRSHVDLLAVARAHVAGRTPNHRLQTLEAFLCGRRRVGDIGGAEIPEAYHAFVRTGDAKDMVSVFHHNRLDLVTMLQLVTIFLSRE